jgi:hypothetical protein
VGTAAFSESFPAGGQAAGGAGRATPFSQTNAAAAWHTDGTAREGEFDVVSADSRPPSVSESVSVPEQVDAASKDRKAY